MEDDIETLPSVSVIIPLYNKAPFIEKTLRSVLAQEYTAFEVIVVDDGSADGGADLVEAFGDPRVRVLRFSNGGVSAARNRGIRRARSELVAFLDADDLWDPRFLGALICALGKYPEAVAAFCAIAEGPRGRNRMPRKGCVIADYPAWFVRTNGRGLWSSNVLAKKDALLSAGGFPEGVQNGEDTDTWFRLSFQGSVVYLPEALARYGADDTASLSRKTPATEPIVIQTLKKVMEERTLLNSDLKSMRIAVDYFRIAYAMALAQGGSRKRALTELSRAGFRVKLVRTLARALVALISGK